MPQQGRGDIDGILAGRVNERMLHRSRSRVKGKSASPDAP